jgi:hypothetical protein
LRDIFACASKKIDLSIKDGNTPCFTHPQNSFAPIYISDSRIVLTTLVFQVLLFKGDFTPWEMSRLQISVRE